MFACFSSEVHDSRRGRQPEGPLHGVVGHIRSAKQFFDELWAAQRRGDLVAVEWAASWCSLSLSADRLFVDLASTNAMRAIRFLRVDLDEVQGIAPGLSVLPSFSVYAESCLKEQFVGLDSCKFLGLKLRQNPWSCDVSETELEGTSCLEGTADALTFSAAASQASDDSSDTLAPTSELNRKSLFSGSVTMPQRLEQCSAAGHSLEERLCISRSRSWSIKSFSSDCTHDYQPRYKRRSLQIE